MDSFFEQAYNIRLENLNVLECGSHCEGNETRKLREKNNCFYIEANPDDYKRMQEQTDVKKENILNFALSDSNGETSFTVSSHPGNSSLNHSDEHKQELIGYGSSFQTITVKTHTFEYLLDTYVKGRIDFLVLDIEGHEVKVLESMKSLQSERLPIIICIEAGYDWPERKKLLQELGYTIDFYVFNNVFASHSSANVPKNIDVMNRINRENPVFIWQNKVIFENDKL